MKYDDERNGFICFSIHSAESKGNTWYVDSGATSHMTNQESFFNVLERKNMQNVTLANGECAKVVGIGSGELKCIGEKGKQIDVIIQDVLYVPDLTESLISVKKLTEKSFTVQFKGEKCVIAKDIEIVATANLSRSMYAMKIRHEALMVKESQHTSECQHIWHRRFGLRHLEDIQKLQDKQMVLGLKIQNCKIKETCECCIKGKMLRTSIPKESTTRASSVFELIHTDLCGPMQNVTPAGKRYLMTVIDDYSRFTEVYFLSNKSEAANCIKDYVKLTENKFRKKVKTIRSDNGREYLTNTLRWN